MAADHHLGLGATGCSSIQYTEPKNITQEVNRTTYSRDNVLWNFQNGKFHDVINDITRSGSTVCEDQLDTPKHCVKISTYSEKNPEKKHFKNADRQTDRQNDKPTYRQVDCQ